MSTAEPLDVGLVDEARSRLEGVHLSNQGRRKVSRGSDVQVLELVEDVGGGRQGGDGVNDSLQLGRVLNKVLDDEARARVAACEPFARICVEMKLAVEVAQADGQETDTE